MKTVKFLMAIAIVTAIEADVCCFAQKDDAKKERKELIRENKKAEKNFYKKSPKLARKTAKEWEREGWRSMNHPIEKQLEKTWALEAPVDEYGYPKYVSVTVDVTATNYSAAQMQAENVAKVRIAGNLCTTVEALGNLALANNETTPELTASISKAVENAQLRVSQKLGRVLPGVTVYRERDGKYEVRMIVLYDQRQAASIAQQIVLDELKAESEENKRRLESILGVDAIQKAYNDKFAE